MRYAPVGALDLVVTGNNNIIRGVRLPRSFPTLSGGVGPLNENLRDDSTNKDPAERTSRARHGLAGRYANGPSLHKALQAAPS
jgi:hypothetical protein